MHLTYPKKSNYDKEPNYNATTVRTTSDISDMSVKNQKEQSIFSMIYYT
jgi:hypothetical protein